LELYLGDLGVPILLRLVEINLVPGRDCQSNQYLVFRSMFWTFHKASTSLRKIKAQKITATQTPHLPTRHQKYQHKPPTNKHQRTIHSRIKNRTWCKYLHHRRTVSVRLQSTAFGWYNNELFVLFRLERLLLLLRCRQFLTLLHLPTSHSESIIWSDTKGKLFV